MESDVLVASARRRSHLLENQSASYGAHGELRRNKATVKLRVKALQRFVTIDDHSFLSRATKLAPIFAAQHDRMRQESCKEDCL